MPNIAITQMCSSNKLAENLAVAETLIIKAKAAGAHLVALPEMFALMSQNPQDYLKIAESPGHGVVQDFLAQMAKTHKLWIVGGSHPLKAPKTTKAYAACLVYDEQGNQVGRYDKINLFKAHLSAHETYQESDTFCPGKSPTVLETPFGKMGLAICYDLRFPELFTTLKTQGAEFIVLPAAFTDTTGRAHWHVLTRARALDAASYLFCATQGGHHASGRKTFGHALAVNPWGEILSEITNTNKASMIISTFTCADVQKTRARLG